jgi:hypothetical protein
VRSSLRFVQLHPKVRHLQVLVDDVPVMQRLPNFSIEHMMVVVNSPSHELRYSLAAQELIEEGRQQGEASGEAKAALRQLNHRCGPLIPATTTRIQALLDFSGAEDLAAWLAEHAG